MEKDENENSCGKIESNGNGNEARQSLETEMTKSLVVFEEIKLGDENILAEKQREIIPEIDINDDKNRRMGDFELHRKVMQEQVASN